MRNLPAASDFTLSIDSRPFWPSLYKVRVAPGWGLPVVRLVTVPSTAAEAREARLKRRMIWRTGTGRRNRLPHLAGFFARLLAGLMVCKVGGAGGFACPYLS